MIIRTHAFRLRVKITIKMISVNGRWTYLEDCSFKRVILLLLIRVPYICNDFLNTTYIFHIALVLKFTSILSSTPHANNTFQRIISHMPSQIEITRWLITFFRYPNNKIECNLYLEASTYHVEKSIVSFSNDLMIGEAETSAEIENDIRAKLTFWSLHYMLFN